MVYKKIKSKKQISIFSTLSELTFQLQAHMICGIKINDNINRTNITQFVLYYEKLNATKMLKDYRILKDFNIEGVKIFNVKVKNIIKEDEDSVLHSKCIVIKYDYNY